MQGRACVEDGSEERAVVVVRRTVPAPVVELVLALGDAGPRTPRHARHVVRVQLTQSPLSGAQAVQVDARRGAGTAAEHQRATVSPHITALQRQAPARDNSGR